MQGKAMIETVFHNIRDSKILESLLGIHGAPSGIIKVLDTTYNSGKMWKEFNFNKSRVQLTTMDINQKYKTDFVDDFMEMRSVPSNNFDVLVFDPPHLPGASKNSSKVYEECYGIVGPTKGREKENIVGMFRPFLIQAKRVLTKKGIILVKLCDLVQGRKYQWQHVDLINIARELEITPCDLAVKSRSGSMISSKWKNQYHLRKSHSYWIVLRLKGCQRERV